MVASGGSTTLQIAAAKSDGVVLGMPRGMMLPILTAAEQQDLGKTMKLGLPTSAYHVDMPKAVGKYWAGKTVVHMELQPMDSTGPDNTNWKAVMDKYGNKSDPRDTFSQAGYLSAKAATEALLNIKGPIDRKTAYDAFKGVKNWRSDSWSNSAKSLLVATVVDKMPVRSRFSSHRGWPFRTSPLHCVCLKRPRQGNLAMRCRCNEV